MGCRMRLALLMLTHVLPMEGGGSAITPPPSTNNKHQSLFAGCQTKLRCQELGIIYRDAELQLID